MKAAIEEGKAMRKGKVGVGSEPFREFRVGSLAWASKRADSRPLENSLQLENARSTADDDGLMI